MSSVVVDQHVSEGTRPSSECTPMLEAAHLNLYRQNTFRITGLAVDASEKQIKREANRIKVADQLKACGTASKHAYALQPPPSADDIRDAMRRLSDPEHRLVDELFWFWPLGNGVSSGDAAIQALNAGDLNTAFDIWSRLESGSSNSSVACHNLAILYHIAAVEWTDFHLSNVIEWEREDKIRGYWQEAFKRWELIAEDELIWDRIKNRIKELNDPRVSSGFARRMAKTLPEALDKINAEAALRFAQDQRLDWAKKHIDWMNETHQGMDNVEKTARLVLGPTTRRVRQLLARAKENTEKHPTSGAEAAKLLVEQCEPLHQLFELFHGESSDHKADLFDEVAGQINTSLVEHGKATGHRGAHIDLMEVALRLSTGNNQRKIIQKNIGIREQAARTEFLEPYLKHVRSLRSDTIAAKDRVQFAKKQVIPSIHYLSGKETPNSPNVVELCEATASAMHAVAVDANNKEKDYETAVEAIDIAEVFAKSPKLRETVATAAEILRRNLSDARNTKHIEELRKGILKILRELNPKTGPGLPSRAHLKRLQMEVAPMFEKLRTAAAGSSDLITGMGDAIALNARIASLRANNKENDARTAAEVIAYTCGLPTSPKVKEQLLKDKAALAENEEARRSSFVDLQIRNDRIIINDKSVRQNDSEITLRDVDGVRWGVLITRTNGVKTSVSYRIGVSGGGKAINIECKRIWRSEEEAAEDFKTIVFGLMANVAGVVAKRVAAHIVNGHEYLIGAIKCSKHGVSLKSGMLMWAKEKIVSWDDVEMSESQGELRVYSRTEPQFLATASVRDQWNAVIFREIASAIAKQ